MTKKQQAMSAVRGMNDILPSQVALWRKIECALRAVTHRYGYQEIRFPVVEKTELFSRSVGDHTDIVEKEMFTFTARNGDSLSLRPEGTAGCVRAGIEHGLLYNQIQRLWYLGPMFRHERPQRGRTRQFHQFGAEAFGIINPAIDVELIQMNVMLWHELGLSDSITLQLNSLGRVETRHQYREALVAYLQQYQADLDEDSQRRLTTNPLRILDSKNITTQRILEDAPCLSDFLDSASRQHIDDVCQLLTTLDIHYTMEPRLVRGLDYYSDTVFEFVTDQLGAQGTVSAGGRYNQLVEQLGGKPTAGAGFALGIERLVELLVEQEAESHQDPSIDIYVISEQTSLPMAVNVAHRLRQTYQDLQVVCDYSLASFKSQFKRADKLGARLALVIGDNEAQQQRVVVKYLREDKPQEAYDQQALIENFPKIAYSG